MVNLPITKVHINGFAVSDCLIDTGAAANLIDSRVFSVVAPSAKLEPPARLVSASGHSLNALGTCCLSVDVLGTGETLTEVDFVVVHNLTHDVVLGWQFLSANHVVLNCSPSQSAKIKLRLKKAVNVPPHSAVCLEVKVDQSLPDSEYLFVGQRSSNVEVADALLRPISDNVIPIYIRNRTAQLITMHRRSVIGYVEVVTDVDECEDMAAAAPESREPVDEAAVEVNAVSADDGRFVGKGTDEILSEFVVGEPITGAQRDKLAALLASFPGAFSRGYADIGKFKGDEVNLELQPGTNPQFIKPYPIPWSREEQLKSQLDELQSCGVLEEGEPAD